MSDATIAQPLAPPAFDRRARVEELLGNILRLMNYPATLELKDLSDGSLGVAMHFEGELPGITPGKRSYLVDCLQFLLNKCINRPGVEKRWVNLGVNGFPEPRPTRPVAAVPTPAAGTAPSAPAPSTAAAPPAPERQERGGKGERKPERAPAEKAERAERRAEHDERTLKVSPEPLISAAATALAEKSAKLGRLYGVMLLSPEDRARVVQAAAAVPGVSVKAEGEGHWRRVTFTPDKPVALPKKAHHLMMDLDEEE